MKVPQVQDIDEVAKVPRSMRRQVPTVSVLTLRAGRTKPKYRQKCRQRTEIHDEQSRKAAEKVMPDVRKARVRFSSKKAPPDM